MSARAVPAMANAHSHAFQLDLRGVGERPAPQPRATTSGAGAPRCTGSPAASTPTRCARSASASTREMARAGYGAVGEFHYVAPPARRDARTRSPTRWRSRSRRRPLGRASRSCCCPPPTTAPARDGATAPTPASGASATPTSTRSWRASTRCARGRPAVPACSVGVAVHSVRAVPAELDRGGRRRTPSAHDLVRHVHACEQRARARRVRGRARLLADRAARPLRLPRPAHQRRARDPRQRPRHRAAGARAARSSSPARRPRATSATATCRRCATATPACRSRSAPTRRSASTRSRRCARWRRWRAPRAPDPVRAARGRGRRPVGRRRPPTAAPASASTGPAPQIELDLDHPDLAGVAERDLPLALATCASAAVVRGVGDDGHALSRSRRHLARQLQAGRVGGRGGLGRSPRRWTQVARRRERVPGVRGREPRPQVLRRQRARRRGIRAAR